LRIKNAQARLQKELNEGDDSDLKTTEWREIANRVAVANDFAYDPDKNTYRRGKRILTSNDPAFATIQIEIMDAIRAGTYTGKVPRVQKQIARNTFKRVVPGTDKIPAAQIDGFLEKINGPVGEVEINRFITVYPNVKKDDLMKIRSAYKQS